MKRVFIAFASISVLGIFVFLYQNSTPLIPDERPNVLLIVIDDLNNFVGCLQNETQALTPHIDTLAAQGTLFRNAHCQAPSCNASRISMLTSIRPSRSKIYNNKQVFREIAPLKKVSTMPEIFARNGYRTYSSGKIFHHKHEHAEFAKHAPYHGYGPFPEEKLAITQKGSHIVDWGVFPPQNESQADHKTANWIIKKLGKHKVDKPFFAAIGFIRPHVPFYASQEWFDLYPDSQDVTLIRKEDDLNDISEFAQKLTFTPWPTPAWFTQNQQWENMMRSYLASSSYIDWEIGRTLQQLKELGCLENTYIVLVSDHGLQLGRKDRFPKFNLWRDTTNVPLIITGPKVPQQQICNEAVESLDILPTLLALCQIETTPALIKQIEGHSLVPLLQGTESTREAPAITTFKEGNHAISTERWRYIRYADGSEELYDIHTDPHEWNNIASLPQHQAVIDKLKQWLP